MSASTIARPEVTPPRSYDWLRNATPLISAATLDAAAELHAPGYQIASPFPHAVIDDLFDDAMLDAVVAAFPGPKDTFWQKYDREHEVKLALANEALMPEPIRLLLYFLNGSTFIGFLERLTGIPNIIPDPHWFGGGMHQIERHGKLAIHADFNRHDLYGLDRRLNLLLYLNKDWLDEYRGHLELWDTDMTACVRKVAPLFNRMVVFSTTTNSYHGHPDELLCPRDRTRRSLALYYYTNGRPEAEQNATHTTIFRVRPGEENKGAWKRRIKPFVPPILVDLFNRVAG